MSPLNTFDINLEKEFKSSEFLQKLNYKKTTTLFNIAFLLPVLIHDPHIHILNDLTDLSKSFGLIFQIADDVEDLVQDQKRQNDSGITCNFCLQIGNQNAISLFKEHLINVKKKGQQLKINTIVIQEIIIYLEKKVITK